MTGRPRTSIGTYGAVNVRRTGRRRFQAKTRFRDVDGRLREVKATGASRNGAVALLKERIKVRPGYGAGGMLSVSSPFGDLADLWLADLEGREISEGTKENYRDDLRVHVRPFFENYTLGEITTGRVEAFLKQQRAVSYSMAKHSRTLLNQLFGYALRQDALARNPVEGTSPLHKPKGAPQALTPEQITAIRHAAAVWRTEPGLPGPKPDGQVRDAVVALKWLARICRPRRRPRSEACAVGRRRLTVGCRRSACVGSTPKFRPVMRSRFRVCCPSSCSIYS